MLPFWSTAPTLFSALLLCSCAVPTAPERQGGATAEPRPSGAGDARGPRRAVLKRAREHRCAAARHQKLIGQPWGEIDPAALPRPLRVYRFGSRISMDYRPERLNVVLDDAGRVLKVRCG